MIQKTTIITYGVCKNIAGKYFLVICGKGIERLSFSNKRFALQKAHSFAKSMYKDFTNDQRQQHFTFENLGELKELNYTKESAKSPTHFIPVGSVLNMIREKIKAILII